MSFSLSTLRAAGAGSAAAFFLIAAALTAGCSHTGSEQAAGPPKFPPGHPPTQAELQRALEQQRANRASGAPGGPAATTPAPTTKS